MSKNKTKPDAACPPKPKLSQRSLLTRSESKVVSSLFKTLANDTRLRMIHALSKYDELCVSDLAEALQMKPQAVSNQLQKMTLAKMVRSRRDGNLIYYRLSDPCLPVLLDKAICHVEDFEPDGR